MKNSRTLLTSSAAIVAAIGLIGGGTFAAWSDFDTYGNEAGAERLTLDLTESGSHGEIGFSETAMAPGENREFDFVIASRGGDVVPAASLTVSLIDLMGTEDGCTSTNSEAAAEGDDCENPGTGVGVGEFIDEAMLVINAMPPTDADDACKVGGSGGRLSTRSLAEAAAAGDVNLLPEGEVLEPGQKVCVRMGLFMPTDSTTNASQGDSATWTFRYDLTQVATSSY